jgi:hypothetical protein
MKPIIILTLLLFFLKVDSAAQQRCIFDEHRAAQEQQYDGMADRNTELNLELQYPAASISAQSRQTITIPVVVHILYENESENITDQQVYAQIDVLNEDFRLLNENVKNIPDEFKPLAVDTEIEFCLASVGPEGIPTSGINRVQTSYDCIARISTEIEGDRSRLFYSSIGGSDAWDTDRYLNIWVGNTCGDFLGLATSIAVPEYRPEEDGIVIDHDYFGNNCNSDISSPYNLGRTTTHEIGHFLGLLHPWGDCSDGNNDLVDDTPAQEGPYYGCPRYPQVSCETSDMYMNFMNYSDDVCMALFTNGQKERMLSTLNGPRSGLLESVGCSLLEPTVPFGRDAISIYPNPVENCIHIDFDADIPGNVEIQLLDAAGQELYYTIESSQNFQPIDATNLSAGIYFVSFRGAKQVITKKIMVLK